MCVHNTPPLPPMYLLMQLYRAEASTLISSVFSTFAIAIETFRKSVTW